MIIFSHTNHYDGLQGDASVRFVLSETRAPRKGDQVYQMFERLGLDFDLPETLRVHPSFRYQLATNEEFGRHPAMVLPFQDATGKFLGIELCFMSDDGRFAPVIEPRQQYWLNNPVAGAFHAIDPIQGDYGIAVGYPNALAARYFSGLAMCAVNTAKDLAAFEIPPAVHSLSIFSDSTCSIEALQLKAKCEILGVRAEVMEPPTPLGSWVHEFVFRGAFPADEIAARSINQPGQTNASEGGNHE